MDWKRIFVEKMIALESNPISLQKYVAALIFKTVNFPRSNSQGFNITLEMVTLYQYLISIFY